MKEKLSLGQLLGEMFEYLVIGVLGFLTIPLLGLFGFVCWLAVMAVVWGVPIGVILVLDYLLHCGWFF